LKDDSYRRSLKIKAKAESIMRQAKDEAKASKAAINKKKSEYIIPDGIREEI
jgi:hypothetical protein